MAVPSNARILRGAPLKTGVILGVSPSSDPTFDVEFARATSSGVYATVARLTPKGAGIPVSYTDLLPDDNTIRLYKARAVKDGWEAGDYTSAVSAKPIILPEVSPNITPLTGKGIGANIYLSTGQLVTFGNASTQAYYNKTVRAVAADCMANTSTATFGFTVVGELHPNSTNNVDHTYFSPVGIPLGALITRVSARVYRGTTGGVVQVSLLQTNSTGTVVTTVTLASTGIGYQTMASTNFSIESSTAYSYNLRVVLRSNNAAVTNARFVWSDVAYRVPALQVGV